MQFRSYIIYQYSIDCPSANVQTPTMQSLLSDAVRSVVWQELLFYGPILIY